MGLAKQQPPQYEARFGPRSWLAEHANLVAGTAVVASCAASSTMRELVFKHGGTAAFWQLVVAASFNPLPFLPERLWPVTPLLAAAAWLATAAGVALLGDPVVLLEDGWRTMTARYSLLQISVFGSALLHITLTFVLNISPIIVQNTPHLQRFKIQLDKAPATAHAWYDCFLHIFASQLLVQLPLITGQYFFIRYFSIPLDFESMPGFWDLAWRCAIALVIDDTWVYFGHRALHDKRIYKYIHKVHHTYTAPFAPDAEYEHPIETVVLGVGFFLACMALTNHLAFMWAWLYVRLLVTYDSHSGYDLPYNVFRYIPCYNGAREHDWHHQFFTGNYAPTFLWWDRLFGTSAAFERHERTRRAAEAARLSIALEERGDRYYSDQPGMKLGPKAGVVDKAPKPVPFSRCLVTGSEGMVGRRLVAMLARRGAKCIVCVDIAEGPTADFKALAERCRAEHGTELTYVRGDISSREDMLGKGTSPSPFAGIETVFHLAALVGPYHKSEVYEAVNHAGAKNVLEAFLQHGLVPASKPLVLVDCSTPSTRYPPKGDINGLMEHEMVYQDTIHEYATTKARGEQAILAANGQQAASGSTLTTCAVAPHQVYAPEDRLFLPAMLETAKSGKLRVFGAGNNIASFTHADNIAHGLVLAGAKLWEEGAASKAAGEFFVVTDGSAHCFWDMVDDAVTECGMPSLYMKFHLPPLLLLLISYVGVAYTKLTGKFVKLTPFTLRMLVINRTFCTAKARHILGYAPVVSFEEGWKETVAAAKASFVSDGGRAKKAA